MEGYITLNYSGTMEELADFIVDASNNSNCFEPVEKKHDDRAGGIYIYIAFIDGFSIRLRDDIFCESEYTTDFAIDYGVKVNVALTYEVHDKHDASRTTNFFEFIKLFMHHYKDDIVIDDDFDILIRKQGKVYLNKYFYEDGAYNYPYDVLSDFNPTIVDFTEIKSPSDL